MSVQLVCPACGETEGLWVEAMFPGWKGIEVYVEDDGKTRIVPTTEDEVTNHYDAELDPSVAGCTCGWQRALRDLVPPEGQSLPNPNQLSMLR